jgi:D-alanyl-D-alanine carboxypeptidase
MRCRIIPIPAHHPTRLCRTGTIPSTASIFLTQRGTFWGNPHGYDPRWVYHGLLIGPPSDAVDFLRRLFSGSFLSEDARSAMKSMHALGGSMAGRPWTKTGYGLGLMMGEMGIAGRVHGHSGVGHDSVSSLYRFLDLPGAPVIAVFGKGTDEKITEFEAVRHALGR